ncbi:MAG TPA: DUF4089 domain-containing protein [Leptolyngbyaceae cyanobacterium]
MVGNAHPTDRNYKEVLDNLKSQVIVGIAHPATEVNYREVLDKLKSMDEKISVAEYVEQMAMLLDLQLKPEHRTGVIENFGQIKAIARLVNEFPLPDNIEISPIFEP